MNSYNIKFIDENDYERKTCVYAGNEQKAIVEVKNEFSRFFDLKIKEIIEVEFIENKRYKFIEDKNVCSN